jgi:hypothetical protein
MNIIKMATALILGTSLFYTGKSVSSPTLLDVPDEVFLKILSFTSARTTGKAREICRHYKDLLDSDATSEESLHKYFANKVNAHRLPKQSWRDALKGEICFRNACRLRVLENEDAYTLWVQRARKYNHKVCLNSLWQNKQDNNKDINESLIGLGDESAFVRKLDGLAKGEYGYDQDLELAKQLNEDSISSGNESAIYRKIAGLANGTHGYDQDLKLARELIEARIALGDRIAMSLKLQGLQKGMFGYSRNILEYQKLHAMIYPRDPDDDIQVSTVVDVDIEEEQRRNDALIEQGDRYAFVRKLSSLAVGYDIYNPDFQKFKEMCKPEFITKGIEDIDSDLFSLINQARTDV